MNKLNSRDKVMAKMTASSYLKHKSPDNINGYTLNRDYGQANSSVFVNNVNKEVVLSIRGTVLTNPEDIYNDIFLFYGKLKQTTRYKELEDRVNKILNEYKEYKITVVGHSLGGSLSLLLLQSNPKIFHEVHIFNPGVSTRSLIKYWSSNIFNPNIKLILRKLHVHTVFGDVISFLSLFLGGNLTTIFDNETLNFHTISNFLKEEEDGVIQDELINKKSDIIQETENKPEPDLFLDEEEDDLVIGSGFEDFKQPVIHYKSDGSYDVSRTELKNETIKRLILEYGPISYFHRKARHKPTSMDYMMNFMKVIKKNGKWIMDLKKPLKDSDDQQSWMKGKTFEVSKEAPFYCYVLYTNNNTFQLRFVQWVGYNLGKDIPAVGRVGNHITDALQTGIFFKRETLKPFKFMYQFHKHRDIIDWNHNDIQKSGNHPIVFQAELGSETYLSSGGHTYEKIGGIIPLRDHTNTGDKRESWRYCYILKPDNYLKDKTACKGVVNGELVNLDVATPFNKGPKSWCSFEKIGHKSMNPVKILGMKIIDRLSGHVKLKAQEYRELLNK